MLIATGSGGGVSGSKCATAASPVTVHNATKHINAHDEVGGENPVLRR